MKRHLCVTALLAAALIPDWASACWPRQTYLAQPRYSPSYREPVYCQPVVCCPTTYPQPGFVAPGTVPMQMQPPLQPPRVVPSRGKSDGAIIPPANPLAARPEPAPAPELDPVRPATNNEPPAPLPAKPDVAKPQAAAPLEVAPLPRELKRAPVNNDPMIPPVTLPTVPDSEPKIPPLTFPKNDDKPPLVLPGAEPKNDPPKPKIEDPLKPPPEPKLPPLELPKPGLDKIPPLELPNRGNAVPAPAPGPDEPAPKIPSPNPGALPPLTLPPDAPVTPIHDKEKEKPKPVEAKSSPLTGAGELKVSVFPATGSTSAAVGGLRKIGFYNHTKRDLALVIEGKSVTLPAMSYLHAQLPPTFAWKCADRPAAKETVPADAAGVDVVIRE